MSDHGVPWLTPGSGKGDVSTFFKTIAESATSSIPTQHVMASRAAATAGT